MTVYSCCFVLWTACIRLLLLTDPTSAQRLAGFSYIGCFVDNGARRDLIELAGITKLGSFAQFAFGGFFNSINLTREQCSQVCSIGGWPYFGLQNSYGCYCGSSYGRYGQSPENNCYAPCSGNASQVCGGYDRNSVFRQTYISPNLFYLAAAPVYQTVRGSLTIPIYLTLSANDKADCIIQCMDGCQAVIFSQQLKVCYLLRFNLIPSALSGIIGDVYIRL